MKYLSLGHQVEGASSIALGCMRIAGKSNEEAKAVIEASLASGINFFDHADIYGMGKSETVFAKAFKELGLHRKDVFIQSKVGIRPDVKTYDFSKKHIASAVDGILARLGIDYLDTLLLHRPDTLVEPQEVADIFNQLHQSGRVKNFGVSNQTPMQIELLKTRVQQPLIINQLQLSLAFTGMIDSGIQANMKVPGAVDYDGYVLDYSRLHGMTIQAWSPFQYGFFEGVFVGNAQYAELNAKLDELAKQYDVSAAAIACAWILRHPAEIQVIIGSMNPLRIKEIARGADITLTREEWYQLYLAAGNKLP